MSFRGTGTVGTKGKTRKVRKNATRKVAGVSGPVKAYVKKAIHRQIENKSYQVQWSQTMGGYNSSNTLYVFPLTPYVGGLNIGQGVTQSTRVGNKIRAMKLGWNFILSLRPYDVATNPAPQPCEAQLMICSLQAAKGELPTSTDIANLYQSNASSIAPSGQLIDLTQKLNTDLFQIHKVMRFKIGFSSNSGTGSNAAYQSYNNNDYKINVERRLNLTKYCPKIITWNDNIATPTSRCVFALWNIVPSTGGTSFGAGVTPVRLDSTVIIDYEDA